MSDDQFVFKVAKAGKIDGKEYKAGDVFPYNPNDPHHKFIYAQGFLIVEVAPQPKTATKKRTSRKSS